MKNLDLEQVRQQAIREIDEEDFRMAVEECKQYLREKRSLWDRLFPWKIVFVKKEGNIYARRQIS